MPTPLIPSTTDAVPTRTGWLSALRHVARPLPAERRSVAALPATRGTAVVVLPAPRSARD